MKSADFTFSFVLFQLAIACLLALPVHAQAPPRALSPAALRAELLGPSRSDVVSWVQPAGPAETARALAALNDRPRDPWLGTDKLLHVAFSFLGTLSCQYALVSKAGVSERRALPACAASGGVVGLTKEVYDGMSAPRNFFSPRDLAADAVGIALAAGFILW